MGFQGLAHLFDAISIVAVPADFPTAESLVLPAGALVNIVASQTGDPFLAVEDHIPNVGEHVTIGWRQDGHGAIGEVDLEVAPQVVPAGPMKARSESDFLIDQMRRLLKDSPSGPAGQ